MAALVGLGGCRTGSPLHGRYNDFRAYYNAYYNASRALEEGEDRLDRPDQAIDRTRLLPLYPSAAGGGRGQEFQEAIDKSSDLLRERADSKWADDALFVIGRAYYYQNNLVGAEQKFRETIRAAEAGGNDRLADEAREWLGRTLGAARRYDEGAAVLQERLSAASGDRRAWARLRLVLGELYAREGRYEEAAEELRAGVADERDGDFAARALMLLGQVLEEAGQYDAAADAYRDAIRQRPPYELAYAAQLSRVLVLGLDAGRTDEALDLARRMRRDDKNYDHRAEVELAYGRLLAAAGREDDALEAMRAVLYDPLLAGGSQRGEAHARLGEFYRDARGDLVRAAAHFDSAATAVRAIPSADEIPTRASLADIRRTADAYLAFAGVAGRLGEADSLLALGALDDDAFAARIAEIEDRRRAEWLEEQRRLANARAEGEFAGAPGSAFEQGNRGNPAVRVPGATGGAPAASGAEAGFLGYRDPASIQANLLTFQRNWGDRPLVPNWRRRAAVEASLVATDVGGPGLEPGRFGTGFPGTGPPPLDLSPIPRTPAAIAQLRAQRAGLRYEAANSLFLSLARPDSAAALYTLALADDPAPEVARQIRFALAEVEAARGRQILADQLYREIVADAPGSPLAEAARVRLGDAPAEPAAAEPTEAPASEAYRRARQRQAEGVYATAVADFLAIAADSTMEGEHARALLAAAVAAVEWARRDSFDVLRPLPPDVIPEGFEIPDATPGAPSSPARPLAPEPSAPEASEPDERGTPPRTGGLAPLPPPGGLAVPPPVALEQPEPDDPTGAEATAADTPAADAVEASGAPPFAADSLAADSSAADTLVTSTEEPAPPPGPTVDDVLALVSATAPGSPYARRAAALRTALAPEAEPEDANAPEAGPAFAVYGFEGEDPIDAAAGGFTWRAQRIPNALAVRAILTGYARRGVRAAAVRDGDAFRVIVGQFATRPDAFAVREDLPSEVQGAGASVVPIEGLELLGPADLTAGE